MEGDPLADVLTLASARCVRIGTLKAGGTWALNFPPPQKIKLTAVVKGNCWLAVDGERAPHRLGTGDVFVVPAERSYVLASDLKASRVDGLALFTKATDNVGRVGDGQDFLAIGGHVALDPDRGGLLADVLPPLIHVDASSSEASTIRWLLDQLVKEVTANRPGAVLASKQLAQLLFVQIIRFYLALPRLSRQDGSERSTTSASRRRCASCTASQVGLGDSATWRSTWGCHEPALRCVSKRTLASPRSPTSRICECELRSRGFATARCRSPSWPSLSATNQTARSATRSRGEPAWHPSTINPSSHGWTSPHQMRPIRIHGTHPERIAYATCVSPPSTNSSTPLT